MKKIKASHKAVSAPIDDLVTFRALPTNSISMEDMNPFIFLNHHGPQTYPSNNNGLPFGPHPHRGMETVTFILDGDIMHKDSSGNKSVITAGGIQWMTAGKGLIHAEVSSDEFKRNGGDLEILQLWLNLPAKNKMDNPFYKGLQEEDIPILKRDDDKVKIKLISGSLDNTEGAIKSVSNVFLSIIEFTEDSGLALTVPEHHVVFFYVVRGSLTVNETIVSAFHLAEFTEEGNSVEIISNEKSYLIFGHAPKLNERIVAHGPFVMNSEEEIVQSYKDYQLGKFGSWND